MSNSHSSACFCALFLRSLPLCVSDFFGLSTMASLPSHGPLLSPLPKDSELSWSHCSCSMFCSIEDSKFLTRSFVSVIPFPTDHAPYHYLVFFLSPLKQYQPPSYSFVCLSHPSVPTSFTAIFLLSVTHLEFSLLRYADVLCCMLKELSLK